MRGQDSLKGEAGEASHRFRELGFWGAGGLLKAGAFSVVLHSVIASLLILGLKAGAIKSTPSLYRVTILPVMFADKEIRKPLASNLHRRLPPAPLRPEPPIEEDRRPMPEVRERESFREKEPVVEKADIHPPAIKEIHAEELKPVPEERKEEAVADPIPQPAALALASSRDLDLARSLFEDLVKNRLPEAGTGGGGRAGSGIGGAGGDGPGAGRGGPVSEDPGKGRAAGSGTAGPGIGSGTGTGEFHWAGFETGVGKGSSGSGLGRPGDGRESAGGGSGKGAGVGGDGSGKGTGTGAGAGAGAGQGDGPGNGRILMPQARSAENPKPIYPQEARAKGYRGEVILRVEVLPNGRAGKIEVKQSSGYEVLDRSALAAVREWKFVPARKGDVPIAFWVNIPIKFQLL